MDKSESAGCEGVRAAGNRHYAVDVVYAQAAALLVVKMERCHQRLGRVDPLQAELTHLLLSNRLA
jgi:hypothetical protein